MSATLAHLSATDPLDYFAAQNVARVERVPQGERLLRLAVLQDAINCLMRGAQGTGRPQSYRDAHDWIARTDHEYTFSFVAVCEVLGLDPNSLRAHLIATYPPQPRQEQSRQEPPPRLTPKAPPGGSGAARRTTAGRLWGWVEAAPGSWTVFGAAVATRVPVEAARGHISRWVHRGLVQRVSAGASSRWASRFVVTRQAD